MHHHFIDSQKTASGWLSGVHLPTGMSCFTAWPCHTKDHHKYGTNFSRAGHSHIRVGDLKWQCSLSVKKASLQF